MQIEAAFDPEPMRRLRQETRELLPVRHVAVIESSISPSNEQVTTNLSLLRAASLIRIKLDCEEFLFDLNQIRSSTNYRQYLALGQQWT